MLFVRLQYAEFWYLVEVEKEGSKSKSQLRKSSTSETKLQSWVTHPLRENAPVLLSKASTLLNVAQHCLEFSIFCGEMLFPSRIVVKRCNSVLYSSFIVYPHCNSGIRKSAAKSSDQLDEENLGLRVVSNY